MSIPDHQPPEGVESHGDEDSPRAAAAARWRTAYEAAPLRDGTFETMSGVPLADGHMTLAPRVVAAARAARMDVPVVVGGIVPDVDLGPLQEAGAFAVLSPGAAEPGGPFVRSMASRG